MSMNVDIMVADCWNCLEMVTTGSRAKADLLIKAEVRPIRVLKTFCACAYFMKYCM